MRNYYEDLSLPIGSTIQEVRKQFRILALKCHPDKNPNDKEAHNKFTIINEAYQYLNNTKRKQEYDQKIAYYILHKSSQSNYPKTNAYRPFYSPPTGGFSYNKKYKYNKENLKKNTKGTIYAFGIVFLVFITVLIINLIANYVKEIRIERLEKELFAINKSINSDFNNENYEIGLQKIDSILAIKKYIGTPTRSKLFKKKQNILLYLVYAAKSNIYQKQSKQALTLLKIIINNYPESPLEIYQLIAIASKEAGHYHDAIIAWKYIEKIGEPTFETASQIGLMYTYYLHEYNKGLSSLSRARFYAINQYKRIFGEGYVLAFKNDMIPDLENHFKVFFALSLCYYHLNNIKEAHDMLTWVKRIGLHQDEYHFLKGIIYQKENKMQLSCLNLEIANQLGHKKAYDTVIKYCR